VTVEQAVVERLESDATVAAIVGARVYQLILPQSPTLPAIRVQLIDHLLRYHLRGGGLLSFSRVQTDAFAPAALTQGGDPYDAANDLADAITAAMSGQRWSAIGTPSIDVRTCKRDARRTGFEDVKAESVRIILDWLIWARHS
jgi:hypothetical protein